MSIKKIHISLKICLTNQIIYNIIDLTSKSYLLKID
nr:MAG TPA_asm: hypothetical protein [Caudoviricetes sp.]